MFKGDVLTLARSCYVAMDGSNQNLGNSELPWASPAYGVRHLQPGDTLVIRAGRYRLCDTGEDMIVPPSGTADAWISICGEEGNRPILVGMDNLYAAFDISNVSYLRIENLEICSDGNHLFRQGISAQDPATHVILDDLYIHHVDEYGISLYDIDGLQLTNSRIEYCGFGAIGGPTGKDGWRNVLLWNCRLSHSGHYYQGSLGFSPYGCPDGLRIEPSEGPIEIADTISEHNRGDGLNSKALNTYIHHCIVANNACNGIEIRAHNSKIENCLIYGTGDGSNAPTPWAGIVIDQVEQSGARFEIINSTLANDSRLQGYPMYVQYGGGVPIRLLMKNCIVSHGPGVVYIGPDVSFTSDHNNFYRVGGEAPIEISGRKYTAAEVEAGVFGNGNLSRDPLFVDVHSLDPIGYELQAGSPVVDEVTIIGAPLYDLLQLPRPYGLALNIRAYEYMQPLTVARTDPADIIAPSVSSLDPMNDANRVPVHKTITVTFTKNVLKGESWDNITLEDYSGKAVEITRSLVGNKLIITPNKNLAHGVGFQYVIPAGSVKDSIGNPLIVSYKVNFRSRTIIRYEDI